MAGNHTIKQIQAGLKLLGLYQGDDKAHAVDGLLGAHTTNAIAAFDNQADLSDAELLQKIKDKITTDPKITNRLWSMASTARGLNGKEARQNMTGEEKSILQGGMALLGIQVNGKDIDIDGNTGPQTRKAAAQFAEQQALQTVEKFIEKYGDKFETPPDPALLLTLAWNESHFNPGAESGIEKERGDKIISKGLVQVQLPTALDAYERGKYRALGENPPTEETLKDPAASLYFAAAKLDMLQKHYPEKNQEWRIRSYNGGEGHERIRDVKLMQAGLTALYGAETVGGIDGALGKYPENSKTYKAIKKLMGDDAPSAKDIANYLDPAARDKVIARIQTMMDNDAALKERYASIQKEYGGTDKFDTTADYAAKFQDHHATFKGKWEAHKSSKAVPLPVKAVTKQSPIESQAETVPVVKKEDFSLKALFAPIVAGYLAIEKFVVDQFKLNNVFNNESTAAAQPETKTVFDKASINDAAREIHTVGTNQEFYTGGKITLQQAVSHYNNYKNDYVSNEQNDFDSRLNAAREKLDITKETLFDPSNPEELSALVKGIALYKTGELSAEETQQITQAAQDVTGTIPAEQAAAMLSKPDSKATGMNL